MPRRSWEFRIADIEAIETVLDYTKEMTFEQFVADRKTIDAVIRDSIIIGEAEAHISEDFVEKHPDIPWREMRNIVVHEYFDVDNRIVWETVTNNLLPLLPLLR